MEENKSGILNKTMEDVLHNSMIPYAEDVILNRALPRIEDGLKPVQRRILYSMFTLGILPDKGFKKSARVVGDCLAKYHPHGDSSVYDAMVRLAQNFNMRNTLVDGHGNFGSIDGDSAAAMRYTEVKLNPLALELLDGLDKDTINWQLNFDDSLTEPETLPGRFPNLLVNGAMGIAVGLATNIPTHNLAEVIDGTVAYISNPKISLEELMKYIKGPDFPTGGYIIADEDLINAYKTGRGKIIIRSRIHLEQGEYGKKNIVITEMPYQSNKAEILQDIANRQMNKVADLEGIADIVDESDRSGMRAVIRCKKDADVNKILKYLYKNTKLQVSYGINMTAIANGKPQQLGLIDIISYYVEYQRQVVLRRTKFDLNKAQERAHIVSGLIIAVNNIDEVIRIIKNSPDTPTARQSLRKAFDLTEKQAQAILDLRLARITKLEVKGLEDELSRLEELIANLKKIVESKKLQMETVKTEMLAIKKKYKEPRRTEIVYDVKEIDIDADSSSQVETVVVGYTVNKTVRRLKPKNYEKAIEDAEPGAKNLFLFSAKTSTDKPLYAFTNKGNIFKMDISIMPESRGSDINGISLEKLYKDISSGEEPICFISEEEMNLESGKLIFFTTQGMVKISDSSEYDLAKSGVLAIKLKDGDELLKVQVDLPSQDEMLFVTQKGMCVRAGKEDVPVQGRTAGGVKGINLANGDKVVFAKEFKKDNVETVIIATDKGYYKKVSIGTITKIARAGKGVRVIDILDDITAKVIFAHVLDIGEKTMIFALNDEGILSCEDKEIPLESRMGRGKNLRRLGSKPKLICAKARGYK